MSYEVANQKITLGQKNTYPEIPGAKRVGTSGFNTNARIYISETNFVDDHRRVTS